MQLTYTNTPDDFIFFHQHFVWTKMRRSILTTQIGLALVTGGLIFVLKVDKPWLALVAGAFTALTVLCVYPIALRLTLRSQAKKLLRNANPEAVLGPRDLAIEEEGLRETTNVDESFRRWCAINEVTEHPKYFFIWVGSGAAFIIPKDRTKGADLIEFIEELRRMLDV